MLSPLRSLLLGTLVGASLAHSATVILDFEGLADATGLTNQYSGLLFGNAQIWTAGLTLNEFEFPPNSGDNVAADVGGPITITFASPVIGFAGFFTYSTALTIVAFDALNQSVGTANSAFGSNFVSSGNPSNELLQVSFAGGISLLSITGSLGGSSFTLDDAEVTTQDAANVPEPPSAALLLPAALIGWALRRKR